jgi:hypothetical protein
MSRYKIRWSTDHESGALSEIYPNKVEAFRCARAWKREMVATEPYERRKEAGREYQWDVVVAEPGEGALR